VAMTDSTIDALSKCCDEIYGLKQRLEGLCDEKEESEMLLAQKLEDVRASNERLMRELASTKHELGQSRAQVARLRTQLDEARAEVPEWCRIVLQTLVVHRSCGSIVAEEALSGVYPDQLRACGIVQDE